MIGEHLRGVVVKQAVHFLIAGDAAVANAEARESGNPAPQPKIAGMVVVDRGDGKTDGSLAGLGRRYTLGKFEQAQDGAEPQRALGIAINGEGEVAGGGKGSAASGKGKRGEALVFEAKGHGLVGGDDEAFVVFANGGDIGLV